MNTTVVNFTNENTILFLLIYDFYKRYNLYIMYNIFYIKYTNTLILEIFLLKWKITSVKKETDYHHNIY